MKRFKVYKNIFLFLFFVVVVQMFGCASSHVAMYSYDSKLLSEADSLFNNGSYELAKRKYKKIVEEYKRTPSGAKAQYFLGYINLYYKNPFRDYKVALREFKTFILNYPYNKKVNLVKNWINILSDYVTVENNSRNNKIRLNELKNQQKTIVENYGTLQEAYLNCVAQKDSLSYKIKTLEGIIAELDKIR